ncbi:MAG: spore germination protein, partial [Lachnospiraceae bacterium]|nr:spore germination protein [Lachnospiraceae bacterium]
IAIVTMEGMVNKETLALSVTNPILDYNNDSLNKENYFPTLQNEILTCSEQVLVNSLEEIGKFIMSGFACILVDGFTQGLVIGIQGFSFRGVSEPDTEVVQRGSREGFVEPLRINMTLLRRRLKNPSLHFETMTLGSVSRTDICLCYMQDFVSQEILDELHEKLDKVTLETVFASGYLVSYLEDDGTKPIFSGVGITERPDTACAKICEGKIVILVDGTPSALVVPHLMVENFQTLDDYTNRPYFATMTRWLKYIAFIISVLMPGLYVALASFNPEFFPSQLLTKIATSIAKTPFSVFSEVLIFTFIYEIMREAGLRLPKTLGHAVSIIGGLVIGETAVNAGLIGSPTLMIVALTAICSYIIPNLYAPIAFLRLIFILVGGIWGVWGVFLILCVVTINICSKDSFGVPYSSPIAPLSLFGLRDVVVRADWRTLARRQVQVQDLKD